MHEIKFLFIVAALGACGWFIYAHISRAKQLVEAWAEENGYRLVLAEHKLFHKGPFWWSTKMQAVYRVVVRDEQDEVRTGWVQLGDPLRGMFSEKVDVRWDDAPSAREHDEGTVLGKTGSA